MLDLDKYVKVGDVLQAARENDMFDYQLAGLNELKEILGKVSAATAADDKEAN